MRRFLSPTFFLSLRRLSILVAWYSPDNVAVAEEASPCRAMESIEDFILESIERCLPGRLGDRRNVQKSFNLVYGV